MLPRVTHVSAVLPVFNSEMGMLRNRQMPPRGTHVSTITWEGQATVKGNDLYVIAVHLQEAQTQVYASYGGGRVGWTKLPTDRKPTTKMVADI